VPDEKAPEFRWYLLHLLFLFVLQFMALSFLVRFSPFFLRFNLFISLAAFTVWVKEVSWWEIATFLGLGVAMDALSFVPFGHFFLLSGITILFAYLWKGIFSRTSVSLFFLFVVFPFVEFFVEEAVSVFARGICMPLRGILLVKCLSIPANIFLFLLWSWGGWHRDVE
jgi:hypothetical protein